MQKSEFLKTAIRAVEIGGEIVDRYFGHLATFESKDIKRTDFVTKADVEAEGAIRQLIKDAYPDHGFWGEEQGQERMDSEYIWIVDSLDSTSNFIYNIPLHAVSAALMHQDEIVVGAVYVPGTEELFWGEKGNGAFCNDWKIQVSATEKLSEAVGTVEFWSRQESYKDQGIADFARYARATKKIRYLSAAVFDFCRVAKGDLDFALIDTSLVDIAATKLLIEEAGGYCRLYTGEPVPPVRDERIMRIVAVNEALSPLIRP